MSKDHYLKQIRNLCLWLSLSGFFNILLLSAFLFWFFQDPFIEEWKPPATNELPHPETAHFKTKKLFSLLKKEEFIEDSSLQDTIFLTPEFRTVEALFKDVNTPKEKLLKMLQEGGYELLLAFHEKSQGNVTPNLRKKFLLAYLNKGSQTAGELLLKTDLEFASKHLGDAAALSLIQHLHFPTNEAISFLTILAASAREDALKSAAKAKYKELTGKSWEPLVSRETSLVKVEKVVPFPAKPRKELLYIVQDGDSLWKIAKKFSATIEEIRELNKLKTDALKPGTPLRVPDRGLQGAKGGISKVS